MAQHKTEAQIDRYNRFGSPMQWASAATIGLTSGVTTFISMVRNKFHSDANFREGFHALSQAKNAALSNLATGRIEKAVALLDEKLKDHPALTDFKFKREQLNALMKESGKSSPDMAEFVRDYDLAVDRLFKECGDAIEEVTRSSKFKEYSREYITKMRAIKFGYNGKSDRFAEQVFGIKHSGITGFIEGVFQRFASFGRYSRRDILLKSGAAVGVASGVTLMAFNQLNTRDKLNEIDKQSESNSRKLDTLLTKGGITPSAVETKEEHAAHGGTRRDGRVDEFDAPHMNHGKHTGKLAESRAEAEFGEHAR